MSVFRYVLASDFHFGDPPYQFNQLARFYSFVNGKPSSSVSDADFEAAFTNHSTYNRRVYERVAAWIADNNGGFDKILLLGDLTADGSSQKHLDASRRELLSDAKFQTFRPGPGLRTHHKNGKLLGIPGNHDRYMDRVGRPNGGLFRQYFGNLWNSSGEHVKRWEAYSRNDVDVHIIGVDFSLSRSGNGLRRQLGQGEVNQTRLNRLVKESDDAHNESHSMGRRPVIIWLMHFCPFEAGVDPYLAMRGLDLLYSEIDKGAKTDLIIHGHLHRKLDVQHIYHVPVLGLGSACSIDNDDAFHYAHILQFKVLSKKEIFFECWDQPFLESGPSISGDLRTFNGAIRTP